MKVKRILIIAACAVGAVFALNRSFLEAVSPPGTTTSRIAVGVAFLLSVIIYLAIIAFKKQRTEEDTPNQAKFWIKVSSVFFIIGFVGMVFYIILFFYWTTTALGEPRQIKGQYIQIAQDWIIKEYGGHDPGTIVVKKALPDAENIFSVNSVNNRRLILIAFYAFTVIGICGTVFTLCEIIGSDTESKKYRGHSTHSQIFRENR